jgi:hypothetical protein
VGPLIAWRAVLDLTRCLEIGEDWAHHIDSATFLPLSPRTIATRWRRQQYVQKRIKILRASIRNGPLVISTGTIRISAFFCFQIQNFGFLLVKYCHLQGVVVTNNNGFWIRLMDLLALLYNYSQLLTVHNY